MRRLLPCGADAVIVECEDGDDALSLWQSLVDAPPAGVREVVPGARTVLLVGATSASAAALLDAPPSHRRAPAPVGVITVPVSYDGADLEEVAARTGLTAEEVVARHSGATYTVAFGGFVPGFAYLTGLDPALRVPRRPTPRTTVPPGSVAIAEEYTGIYPRASPGGWNLLGSTDLQLFDQDRVPPATLQVAMTVRFAALR